MSKSVCNIFTIRSKASGKKYVDVATFRDFYELEEFFHNRNYIVSMDTLGELKRELEPIVEAISKISDPMILNYDAKFSYPKKCKLDSDELCDHYFNPINSVSLYPAYKVRRLYSAVIVMIEYLLLHDEHYIEYSSIKVSK